MGRCKRWRLEITFIYLIEMRKWPAKRILKWLIFAALAALGFYAFRFALFIFIVSRMLYQRDLMDASANNARGDVASAETDFFGAPEHRATTLIRLHRADHWFSTTLVDTRSFDVLVGLKWRDINTLDLQLDFGCEPRMDPPVTQVGPIHIVYHWGDPGQLPNGGYETFRRRDLPPGPCPATGARQTGPFGARAFTGPTQLPTS